VNGNVLCLLAGADERQFSAAARAKMLLSDIGGLRHTSCGEVRFDQPLGFALRAGHCYCRGNAGGRSSLNEKICCAAACRTLCRSRGGPCRECECKRYACDQEQFCCFHMTFLLLLECLPLSAFTIIRSRKLLCRSARIVCYATFPVIGAPVRRHPHVGSSVPVCGESRLSLEPSARRSLVCEEVVSEIGKQRSLFWLNLETAHVENKSRETKK
jgi:hypothetical protein